MSLELGAFFFCSVDMPDAGVHGTPPQDRRFPGMLREQAIEQLERFARDVMPRVSVESQPVVSAV